MHRIPPLLLPLALLLGALLLGSPSVVRAESSRPFKDVAKAVDEILKAEDPKVRLGAFGQLADCHELAAVEFLLKRTEDLQKEMKGIRATQQDIEDQFEKQFGKKVKLDSWFEGSNRSPRDLKRYNDEAKKIRKQLDKLHQELRNLEDGFAMTRNLLRSAVPVMGAIVRGLPEADLEPGLLQLDKAWRDGRDGETRFWWLDALAESKRTQGLERVCQAAQAADLPADLRAAALQTLGGVGHPQAFDLALPQLASGSPWDLTAAAIDVMRSLHEKRCIEPLIEFLGRDDIKRLREDAHAALKSLTAEKHGPYQEPWKLWWRDHGDGFQMPPRLPPEATATGGEELAPGERVTFYGIQTFSDRILFILDVSGSMDQIPPAEKGAGPQRPKIDVARQELMGAIDLMNDGYRFNMIFFNHQVLPWQPKMQEVADSSRRRARKWIEEQVPEGGTNIYDALEAGFALALRVTGDPVIDTIFFLTDGRPTSGKIQNPERILGEVEEWNRAARLKIHCVGVGDHDQDFMQRLAKLTGGQYVRR